MVSSSVYRCKRCGEPVEFFSSVSKCWVCGSWLMIQDSIGSLVIVVK